MEIGKVYFFMLGTRDIFGRIKLISDSYCVIEHPILMLPSPKGMQVVSVDYIGEITEITLTKSSIDAYAEAGHTIRDMWKNYVDKQKAKKSGIILGDIPPSPINIRH
jgi:hypothetical protein